MSLNTADFSTLFDEALEAYYLDGKVTVETEPVPGKRVKKTAESR